MRERDETRAARSGAGPEAVLDAIADGLVVFGRLGEVRSMNEAALRYVAGDPSAAPAAGVPGSGPRFVDAEGRPLAAGCGPVERALAGETMRSLHLRTIHPETGRRGWVAASAAPIRGADGRIEGAVLTFSDETRAYGLHEERDDLLRAITHDLRTPLNAILMQAHLAERGAAESDRGTAERARAIVKSCERMSEMLQELADSAMLEAGRLPFAPQPVDVAAFVEELLGRLRGGLDVDRVRFTAGPVAPALADPRRLERILVNLVSNALKYSPGQTEVEVRTAAVEGGVELSVVDHGIGISPEDQVHLFERWFRSKGTRRPEGLGLGLYITRLLVEAQGGRIRVETAMGQGSTFRVWLPAFASPGRG